MKLQLRYTIGFFICIFILVGLYFNKEHFLVNEKQSVQPRLIIPKTASEKSSDYSLEVETLPTAIDLSNDEFVINTQVADINFDSFEDQIIAVRKNGTDTIFVIVGLYNQSTTAYDRISVIDTEITQPSTFTLLLTDILGNHSNAIVFSGSNNSSELVFKAFIIETVKHEIKIEKIADITTDGSAYLQQTPRSEAYELYKNADNPYPIVVVKSDTSYGASSLDQIQYIYQWNATKKVYEPSTETKIPGKKIEEKERAKIQDGKVETFEHFIDGLWYKVSDNSPDQRYIFFDFDGKEIVFFSNDTQEIYLWQNSILRRNGLSLSSVNNSISNLIRRFDISLSSVDEVKIKINDDVKMIIGEDTLWDGLYRKWIDKKAFMTPSKNNSVFEDINFNERQVWLGFGNKKIVLDVNSFEISDENESSKGSFALRQVGDEYFLQFRTLVGKEFLKGYYQVALSKEQGESGSKEFLRLCPAVGTVVNPISTKLGDIIVLERVVQ
ncbi:MAG: pallilysin-related adhesin [Treponemataceae bacterium]